MFDRLIESYSAQAEFKPRRKFFLVSSVIVGIAFCTAVVAALYAKDIEIGNDSFELTQLLAPVTPNAPEPEQPEQQPQAREQQEQPTETSRRKLIARIDQPQVAPEEISTTPNRFESIPDGRFILNPNGPDTNASAPTGSLATGIGSSSSATTEPAEPEVVKTAPPPPAESKPKAPITGGVVNGKATYLPNPPYPLPAKQIGAQGIVNVQVTIDEQGKVISSKAISGHPLLRGTAEAAAWKARFSPTLLTDVPVKVTGLIVFNFIRN